MTRRLRGRLRDIIGTLSRFGTTSICHGDFTAWERGEMPRSARQVRLRPARLFIAAPYWYNTSSDK